MLTPVLTCLTLVAACTSAPDTSAAEQERGPSTTTTTTIATTLPVGEATTTFADPNAADLTVPETSSAPDVPLGPNRFLELLGSVADTPENRAEIFFADVALAAASVGIETPDQDQDHFDYFKELGSSQDTSLGLPSPQSRPAWLAQTLHVGPEVWLQTYGWTPADIRALIEVGTHPTMTVGIQTRRPGEQITEALAQSTGWPAGLTSIITGQGEYFRSGDNGVVDLDVRTELNPVGISQRILVSQDGTVFVTRTDELTQQLFEVETAEIPSLAENPAIQSLAAAMHHRQMSSAYLFSEPYGAQHTETSNNAAPRALMYGLGYGVLNGERRALWVAHYETGVEARAAEQAVLAILANGVSPMDDAWSAQVRVVSSEISGTTLEIMLEPETIDILIAAALFGNELFSVG